MPAWGGSRVEQTVGRPVAEPRGGFAGWYGLTVVILASVIGSVIGRGLIPLVAESVRLSLHLTDGQLGLLTGLALTFVTAIAALPIGWLADRVDRRWLLAACVLIWSAGTTGFGLAHSFGIMFVFTMAIALGEAVLGPITYSLIPDLFPRERWVLVNSVFAAVVLLGTYVGMALAGQLIAVTAAARAALPLGLSSLDPWRAAMVLASGTGLILAPMVLAMRVKRTGLAGASERAALRDVIAHFRAHGRALLGVFAGFGLSYAAFGAQSGWSAVILQRQFGADPAEIGQVLGVFGAVASLAGVAAGLLAVRVLRSRWGDATPMLVAQAGLFAALVVSFALPLVQSATQFYIVSLLKVGLTYMATSLSPTVLQLIAPARMRGRVVAIGGMLTIVCGSLMPWLIGLVSDSGFAGPNGLLLAMTAVVVPAMAIGLFFLRWGSTALPATVRAVAEADQVIIAR